MKIAIIASKTMQRDVIGEKAINRMKAFADVSFNEDELEITAENVKKTIKDADIAIASWGNTTLDGDILDECPNLKLIVHAAGSVKPIVSDEVWKRGIRVCASTKPLGIGVAETSLGLAISACKNFYQCNDDIHNGGYNDHRANVMELYDITVGVISAGWVGRHFIKLMNCFDVEILLYDPYVTDEQAAEMGCKKVEFKELLERSDIVSIHAPSIPATNHMFNEETLGYMKDNAIIINTSRGTLIDENALYRYMSAGKFKYACLDVYDPEPLTVENPLRTLKNAILTPHIAGLAGNGKLRIGMHAADQIENYIGGKALECEVREEMLATMA